MSIEYPRRLEGTKSADAWKTYMRSKINIEAKAKAVLEKI
jgi:hypothetical protein